MNGRPNHPGGGQSPHLNGDRCLDLLLNLLPHTERDRAFEHIASCATCERLFKMRFAERERLRAAGKLVRGEDGQLALQTLEPDAEAKPSAPRNPLRDVWNRIADAFRSPRLRLAGGLVAAAVTVLIILIPLRKDDGGIAQPHWLPGYSEDLQFRAMIEATADEDLAAGLQAYADRDLDQAVQALEKAETSGTMEKVRKVYLGSALALSGNHTRAIEILESVAARTLPDPWGSEACWSLYVALNESGRAVSADSLLRVLSGESGSVGDRARETLDREER